jgi:uncharacterized membrane protein required for colicin V production
MANNKPLQRIKKALFKATIILFILSSILTTQTCVAKGIGTSGKQGETSTLKRVVKKIRTLFKKKKTSTPKNYYFLFALLFLLFFAGYYIGLFCQLVALLGSIAFLGILQYCQEPILQGLAFLGADKRNETLILFTSLILLCIVFLITMHIWKSIKKLTLISYLAPFDRLAGSFLSLLGGCIAIGALIIFLEETALSFPDIFPMRKSLEFLAKETLSEDMLQKLNSPEFLKSLRAALGQAT